MIMGREPLAIRVYAVAAIMSVVSLAVLFGLPLSTAQVAGIETALTVVSALVVVAWTRGKVTPVDDPRDDSGLPLVSVDDIEFGEFDQPDSDGVL